MKIVNSDGLDKWTYLNNKYKSSYMLIENIYRDIEGLYRIRTSDRTGYKPLFCTVSFCIKFREKNRKSSKKVGPAGIEPATWRITAIFLLGYKSMNYFIRKNSTAQSVG